jgi:polysaccharide biosynthesis protein PelE
VVEPRVPSGRQERWAPLALALALLASEAVGLVCVCLGHAGGALLAHLLAGLVTLPLVRARRRPNWPASAALAPALFVLLVPVAGAVIVLAVLLPAWRRRRGSEGLTIVDLPPASEREPDSVRARNPRAIRELLATSQCVAERLEAVLALRRLPAQRAVPLLKLCFEDRNEDVRLLAFADLERRESKLRARLQQTSVALAAAAGCPRQRRAHLERRLAGDHWELVYGGFVSGALEARVLEAVADHAEAAFELGSRATAAILLARVALRRRLPDRAWRWLEAAEVSGVSQSVCAPLFAEAAYARRRFAEVGPLLSRATRSQLRRPGLDSVVDFWTRRDAL